MIRYFDTHAPEQVQPDRYHTQRSQTTKQRSHQIIFIRVRSQRINGDSCKHGKYFRRIIDNRPSGYFHFG